MQQHKIAPLIIAYLRFMQGKFRARINAGMPKPTSVTYWNLLEWINVAKFGDLNYYDMFEEAHKAYSADFCQRVFKTPYAPFNVVFSRKTLDRVRKQFPVSINSMNMGAAINQIVRLLEEEDVDFSIKMIEMGAFTQGNQAVKSAVLEVLHARHASIA